MRDGRRKFEAAALVGRDCCISWKRRGQPAGGVERCAGAGAAREVGGGGKVKETVKKGPKRFF